MSAQRFVPVLSLMIVLAAAVGPAWAQSECNLGEGLVVPEGTSDCVDGHIWKCAGGQLLDTGVACTAPPEPDYSDEDGAIPEDEGQYEGSYEGDQMPPDGMPQGFPGGAPQGFPGPAPQGFPGAAPKGSPGGAPQGFPGGAPQGFPGGAPKGFPGPAPQGFPGGAPKGFPGGAPQGFPGGAPQGFPGGTIQGFPGGAQDPSQPLPPSQAAAAARGAECQKVCAHVVECGTNTMEGCLALCAGISDEQLAAVAAADCESMRAATPQNQPAGPFGENGGGTASDCAAIGGSLGGQVCSGPPFACRTQGCPPGWSCGVEGLCHSDRFPNCKRCP